VGDEIFTVNNPREAFIREPAKSAAALTLLGSGTYLAQAFICNDSLVPISLGIKSCVMK